MASGVSAKRKDDTRDEDTAAAVNAPVPSGAMVAQRLSTLRWI